MKTTRRHNNVFGRRSLAWLAFTMGATLTAAAAPLVQTNAIPAAPRSIFTQPANFQEGRDPFFPASTRPYASAVVASAPTTDLSSLVCQGTSGTTDHRLAIVNNVTFGVGDSADVITPHGRIRIHCVEIADGSVLIESGGQRQTLRYSDKP
jgi:hypothetical protein